MPRRDVVFGKGRDWTVADDNYAPLHLEPGRGAAIGEYAAQESSEYSDSYYAPGNDEARRQGLRVGGVRGGGPSFGGRGPKGYRRRDERVLEDICERLTDDPHVDASDISVAVNDGTAILTGSVADRRTKRYVEDLVEACSGVLGVDNRLRCHGNS